MNRYYNPVTIYFGNSSVAECVQDLQGRFMAVSRVLILVRDKGVEQSKCLEPVMALFADRETCLIEVSLHNPDIEDIHQLIESIGAFPYELILAIGGGSVMDAAKALAALQHMPLSSPAEVREAIMEERYSKKAGFTPWIGIPTTSGTGSEVTSWATIWDEKRGCKYSIADGQLFASAAIVLPELTVTKPLRLSVATALDAICHATEAYWSVHSNPVSRAHALQAIERICRALPCLIEEPHNLAWREQLSLGSVLAGLAFSNTKTTACHSISYPLTLLYGIDHGIAASLSLAEVFRHNYSMLIEPDKLLRAFGAQNVGDVQQFLHAIYAQYGLSGRLSDYGITEHDIAVIVSHAYTKGRMDNNPVPISPEELEQMLFSLL